MATLFVAKGTTLLSLEQALAPSVLSSRRQMTMPPSILRENVHAFEYCGVTLEKLSVHHTGFLCIWKDGQSLCSNMVRLHLPCQALSYNDCPIWMNNHLHLLPICIIRLLYLMPLIHPLKS